MVKASIKLDLNKRIYALFSKPVGSVIIPLLNLQGVLSYEGVITSPYKNEKINIHYKLDLKRYIDRKLTIKQYRVDKKYNVFDIKKSDEMNSHLNPKDESPPSMPTETKTSKEVSRMDEDKPVQPQQVRVRPAKNQEPEIEEPKQSAQEESNINHPLAKDLLVLGKAEFTEYLGQLKAAKPAADKQGIELKSLVGYDKDSFSCKFITLYTKELEKLQTAFVEAKVTDIESSDKCRDIMFALAKKQSQIERNIGAGKLTPDVYLGCLKTEFDGLVPMIKFVKKYVKNQKVLAHLFAKAQIIDGEIKELEEFINNS